MASPAAARRHVPATAPRDEPERQEPSHPEPACQEAQKWIEVSGVGEWAAGCGGPCWDAAGAYRHILDINTGAPSPVLGTTQCRVTVTAADQLVPSKFSHLNLTPTPAI